MATATPALALRESPAADAIELPAEITGSFSSLNAFFAADFNEPDQLLVGLHRGEVALLVSDEAQGKTHLLLQLALALAAGQPALSIASQERTPRRLVFVNGDAAASRLRNEALALLPGIAASDTAQDNIRLLVDARLKRQPLNLYRNSHWQWFAASVKQQPADLIIIDGMREPLTLTGRSSAAARLQLLKNARQLAADEDCAVLVAYTTSSRRRLIGTALGQTADTIYSLTSDWRRDKSYRQWQCSQSRWALPEPLELQRDAKGGGYRLCGETAEAKRHEAYSDEVATWEGRRSRGIAEAPRRRFNEPSALAKPVNDTRRLNWQMSRPVGWQASEGGLSHAATAAASLAGAGIKAARVGEEMAKPLTAGDKISDSGIGKSLSGGSSVVTNLPPENDEIGMTESGENAPKKKGGKQANKRHNKKMRRYR